MPTRLEIEVGASYLSSPAAVKAAMQRSDGAGAARAEGAGARCAAARLRRLRDHLPRALLGGRLRARRGGAGRGADGDLLRLRPPRHRDSVADPGRLLARLAGARRGGEAGAARAGAGRRRSLPPPDRRAAPRPSRRVGDPGLRQRRGDRPAGRAGRIDVHRLFGPVAVVLEPDGSEVATIERAATSARCRC